MFGFNQKPIHLKRPEGLNIDMWFSMISMRRFCWSLCMNVYRPHDNNRDRWVQCDCASKLVSSSVTSRDYDRRDNGLGSSTSKFAAVPHYPTISFDRPKLARPLISVRWMTKRPMADIEHESAQTELLFINIVLNN